VRKEDKSSSEATLVASHADGMCPSFLMAI